MANQLFGLIKGTEQLKWASSLSIKQEFDKQLLALLGPKDERDDPKNKVRG